MSAVRMALLAGGLVLACGATGCAPTTLPASELDPQATFAAHQVRDGFLLDRLPDSDTGIVEPSAWINLSGTPRFRVRTTRGTQGTLRLTSPARVVIHDAEAQPAAEVAPSWDSGAIHLALLPVAGPPLRLGPFERIGGDSGYSVLTRNALTTLDLQGVYRAKIRDAHERQVGWLQVRIIESYGARLFQGVLPGVSPEEQAGLMLALNSESDWIENQALDVHRGISGGRGGHQSTGGR
jgi:hypothetical protein